MLWSSSLVHPWFIPFSGLERNSAVERFNNHCKQRVLGKVALSFMLEHRQESLVFEVRQNNAYRYGKLKRKNVLKALAEMATPLVFPGKKHPLRTLLDHPRKGCYHLVRFIRSNCQLSIFGEMFPLPPEAQYEYAVAIIVFKDR